MTTKKIKRISAGWISRKLLGAHIRSARVVVERDSSGDRVPSIKSITFDDGTILVLNALETEGDGPIVSGFVLE